MSISFCSVCCELGCVLVKAAAYSGHALDKLYSILCTFKFKFLTNKKKWYHYADEQNLNFRSVNFINAHKKCRWYDYQVFHMDPKEKKRLFGTGKIMFKINRRNSLSDRGRYL